MKFTPAKLFHAVVISGAALTGCATTAKPAARTNTTTAPSAADVNATPAHAPDSAARNGGSCPPGSERPFPPCYWIK